ncbi:M23 family metallopeptidase [Halobacillus rhizosphaerae]|uniref:M23 family metallopeptidase n=1 Tax=Halobacillus rhizosphaerae TaxID=3064889 RepID=UPI00398AED22
MKVKLNGNDFFEVSSSFGATDNVHLTPHSGIDLVMNTGTKIFSPTDGIISKVVDYGNSNIGKGVMVKTNDGETIILGHLSDNSKVEVGQHVQKGDFLGLSGNTGNSTGSHLHFGLKDSDGSFISPDKYLNSDGINVNQLINDHGGVITKIIAKKAEHSTGDGMFSDIRGFMDLINRIGNEGFFQAVYGKSFFEVIKDFIAQLLMDIYTFIISNGEAFFIIPAILIMFATFIIGRNKYTKFIIPLWMAYFLSVVLRLTNCLPPQT